MTSFDNVITQAGDRKAFGPYSLAVEAGGVVYLAGQLGWDFEADALVEGVAGQARAALEGVKAVLAEAGLGLDSVAKVTLYIVDMADWPTVNEIWSEYFTGDLPARTAIAVKELPKGAGVEMDVIAVR